MSKNERFIHHNSKLKRSKLLIQIMAMFQQHFCEPNRFVLLLQAGYQHFIQLIETPHYQRFKTEPYSIHKDLVWRTDTRKNRAELKRIAFYHCEQVGTPQALSNEQGECIWELTLNTWGQTQQIKTKNQENSLEQSDIRFQGHIMMRKQDYITTVTDITNHLVQGI